MTDNFRKTVRSFLNGERPATREEAMKLVQEWFGRYDPDPELLAEEVERYFAAGNGPSDPDRALTSFKVAV